MCPMLLFKLALFNLAEVYTRAISINRGKMDEPNAGVG